METLSRRELVRRGAATAYAAAIGAAITGPALAHTDGDPIFGVLEAYHRVHRAFQDARQIEDPEWSEVSALHEADAHAWEQCAMTIPTTVAGCAALIEAHRAGTRRGNDYVRGDAFDVLATISTALRNMGASA